MQPYIQSSNLHDLDTTLHLAILDKKQNDIDKLLEKKADPNLPDKDGFTPLHHAVIHGLIPLSHPIISGLTFLDHAITDNSYIKYYNTVDQLLGYNADPNLRDLSLGYSCLHYAVAKNDHINFSIIIKYIKYKFKS